MSGWWVVAFVALWVYVILLTFVAIGAVRIALARRPAARKLRAGLYPSRPEENGPGLGSVIPDLTVQSTNGHNPISLRMRRSKRLLIMFMTPTCEGCQDVVDPINDALERAATRDTDVLIILSGPEMATRSFLKLFPLRPPAVPDLDHSLAATFGVHETPAGLLFDETGVLRRKGIVTDAEQLSALLEPTAVENLRWSANH